MIRFLQGRVKKEDYRPECRHLNPIAPQQRSIYNLAMNGQWTIREQQQLKLQTHLQCRDNEQLAKHDWSAFIQSNAQVNQHPVKLSS